MRGRPARSRSTSRILTLASARTQQRDSDEHADRRSSAPSGATPTVGSDRSGRGADFKATPPPAGSPPIILARDGWRAEKPRNGNDNNNSVNQVASAYASAMQIRTFIIGLNLQGSTATCKRSRTQASARPWAMRDYNA